MSKSAFENTVDKSKVKKESELFDIPFDDEGNLDLYRQVLLYKLQTQSENTYKI